MFNFLRKKAPLKVLTDTEFNKVKFKARIAFIDDEELANVDRLRSDGYNITHFSDIQNIDDFIRKEYHVIILDIQGVGKEISPIQEGWGILKYLKEEYPHIVVVVFTGADWSINQYREIANKADDFVPKDLEFLDFKYKLDSAIRKAFSDEYHFDIEKDKITGSLKNKDSIYEIKKIIDNYGADENKTISLVKKYFLNPDALKNITTLLSVLNEIRKLFN